MSETGNDDSSFDGLSGFALLQALQIPTQPLVYCDQLQALVKVTDRSSATGLCLNVDPQSGLYMTADELYACANYTTKMDYHYGFFVATPSNKVFQEYGLQKQTTAYLSSSNQFIYFRNFEIAAAGFTYFHKDLGYLHDTEISQVMEIDEQREEAAKIATTPNMAQTPGKSSATSANKNLFNSPNSPALSALVSGDGNTQVHVQHQLHEKVKLKLLESVRRDSIISHREWKKLDTNDIYSIKQLVLPVHKTIDDLFVGRSFVLTSGKYEWYNWSFDDFYDKLLQCFQAERKDVVNAAKKNSKFLLRTIPAKILRFRDT
jgi:hypothetical protein